MAGMTGKTPSATYKDLLKIENSNSGIDDTLRQVEDGAGDGSALYIETNSIRVKPEADDTALFDVHDKDGNSKFKVDTSNDLVTAVGHYINTQYAYFGVSSGVAAYFVVDAHHPLPFVGNNTSSTLQDNITFGTDTDPATTFTTADGSTTDASLLVNVMWLVPDNITIDAVHSLEGVEGSGERITRMHLFSYTFTSGSTSALTSGTLLAHNSDVTNDGSEQAYKSTWTVDSANVNANKVILAFFQMDTVDNPSVNITVKYHLR